jgi:hypothetical protein
MRRSFVVILGAALSAVTCAESQPAAPPPATPAAAASAAAAAPEAVAPAEAPAPGASVNWAAMSKEHRKDYMKTVVMPQMKQTFIAFNADRYKSMTCVTCHGDGATDGKFTMPNPKLPKLPNSPEGFQRLMASKPEVMQFMATKVKPQMAQLLGLPEFTPENKNGFGCFACHTKEGQ